MTIEHHLNDSLLMAYSSGNVPEAFSLVIATHVSLCDECRARLGSFDAVGGVLLEDCDDAEVSESAFDMVMNRIATTKDREIRPRVANGAIFPGPLREYAGGDLDDVKWRSLGGGVKQSVLKTRGAARVRLLRIPAGAAMPDHGHRGTELTLVLKGAFRDDGGRYSRGDIEVADVETSHTPIAEAGEDCICLTATDAPLRFSGLLPRIAQPFVGI